MRRNDIRSKQTKIGSEEERLMNELDAEMGRKFPHVTYEGAIEPDEDEMDYVSSALRNALRRM